MAVTRHCTRLDNRCAGSALSMHSLSDASYFTLRGAPRLFASAELTRLYIGIVTLFQFSKIRGRRGILTKFQVLLPIHLIPVVFYSSVILHQKLLTKEL